jgi:hypothetical protein
LPNGLTVGGVNYPSTGPLSNRNKIINGAMVIDQRNAGAAVTHSGSADLYVIDRMVLNSTGTPQFSCQQVTDAPPGFTFSAKLTTTTVGTPAAADFSYFGQYIEGFNVADFAFGTASATTVTISFWVKSSLTGTFGGALRNGLNNRAYPFTYAISAANTWEYKTVTIPGDTTGTWANTNGRGMILLFDTGSGSNNKGTAGAWNATSNIGATGGTNLVATAGATWQITGVQLEAGTVATPFEHRSFGQELALCQRYAQVYTGGNNIRFALGGNTESTNGFPTLFTPVVMRSAPSVSVSAASDFKLVSHSGTVWTPTSIALDGANTSSVTFSVNVGAATSNSVLLAGANSNAKLTLSSEL